MILANHHRNPRHRTHRGYIQVPSLTLNLAQPHLQEVRVVVMVMQVQEIQRTMAKSGQS